MSIQSRLPRCTHARMRVRTSVFDRGQPTARLTMLTGILEDRRDIARRVQDTQDCERSRGGIVNDQIREHRPELDRLVGKVFTQMTDAGAGCKDLEGVPDFSQYVACYGHASVLDEVRLDEVEIVRGGLR